MKSVWRESPEKRMKMQEIYDRLAKYHDVLEEAYRDHSGSEEDESAHASDSDDLIHYTNTDKSRRGTEETTYSEASSVARNVSKEPLANSALALYSAPTRDSMRQKKDGEKGGEKDGEKGSEKKETGGPRPPKEYTQMSVGALNPQTSSEESELVYSEVEVSGGEAEEEEKKRKKKMKKKKKQKGNYMEASYSDVDTSHMATKKKKEEV